MQGGYGFLLLTSHLGNPLRKPLSIAQLHTLTQRMHNTQIRNKSESITVEDLIGLGYDKAFAAHIIELLDDELLLEEYLKKGKTRKCFPITRQNPAYPLVVRRRLGLDSPGCLWSKGDSALLDTPAISLVGSRSLLDENMNFAVEVGRQAALQGFTLVSGNASGADTAAQEACLSAGGAVISVVADALHSQLERKNVLYISEEDFDEPFSPFRALRRNRVIHSLGYITFVAQCALEKGGTWNGTVKNLSSGWSKVFCFDDGSPAMRELEMRGAELICMDQLCDMQQLINQKVSLFD